MSIDSELYFPSGNPLILMMQLRDTRFFLLSELSSGVVSEGQAFCYSVVEWWDIEELIPKLSCSWISFIDPWKAYQWQHFREALINLFCLSVSQGFTQTSTVDLSHLLVYTWHLPYAFPRRELGLTDHGNEWVLRIWSHSKSSTVCENEMKVVK